MSVGSFSAAIAGSILAAGQGAEQSPAGRELGYEPRLRLLDRLLGPVGDLELRVDPPELAAIVDVQAAHALRAVELADPFEVASVQRFDANVQAT
jgi:hypothetical protein